MYGRDAGFVLASAFLGGKWEERPMWARGRKAYGHAPPWLRRLVREVLAAYPRPPEDRPRELAAYIDLALLHERPPHAVRYPLFSPRTLRAPWPVPRIDTTGELAERLELDAGQLGWLADVRGLERHVTDERLRNYRYLLLPRPGGPPRVIERPKLRLKEIQRRILREILAWIPVHDAAHGFVAGRSALTHAARHTGKPAVLRVARRGLPRERAQDAADVQRRPPDGDRHRRQRAPQRPARRLRPAQGAPAQRRP